ncbi:hypothetical protein HK096_003051 [Nowakowskiella sp. JEL0078]|nr:hypothetical protein HK096_003051 [Nowakowskiella sp. JEL0078]
MYSSHHFTPQPTTDLDFPPHQITHLMQYLQPQPQAQLQSQPHVFIPPRGLHNTKSVSSSSGQTESYANSSFMENTVANLSLPTRASTVNHSTNDPANLTVKVAVPPRRVTTTGPDIGGAPAAATNNNNVNVNQRPSVTTKSINKTFPLNQNSTGFASGRNLISTKHTPAPYIDVVKDAESMKNSNISADELLEQGNNLMAKNQFEEAILKWRSASEAASLEGDLLRESKAYCSMSVGYRILGSYDDALQYIQWSWKLSCSFIDEAQQIATSPWVDLVAHYIELDSDMLAQPRGQRKSFELIPRYSVSNPVIEMQGPAIVVWFMQLATAFGNAYYALGQHELSIHWHDICLRLADAVLEEFPMPYTPGTPINLNLPRLKLSYVHRSTVLAQIRSLTHIGLCNQQLGQEQDAFSFHTRSHEYLLFLLHHSPATAQKSPVVQKEEPVFPVAKVHQPLATAANPPTVQIKTTITINPPESAQKYHAAVLSNIGNSYFAKGLLPVSMDRHLRAAAMFRELDDSLGHARESANIGALWIELGRTITNLEWLKRCNLFSSLQTRDAEDSAKENWGPPRIRGINSPTNAPDECAVVAPGMKFLEGGATRLYDQLEILKKFGDWTAMCTIWMNLGKYNMYNIHLASHNLFFFTAAGYTLMHQPHWALHNITRLLSSPPQTPTSNTPLTPTFKSAASKLPNKFNMSQLFNRIPRSFLPHIFHSILQSLILLERVQPTSKEDSVNEFGHTPTVNSNNTSASRTSNNSFTAPIFPPEVTDLRLASELINNIQLQVAKELQNETASTEINQPKTEEITKIDAGELQEGHVTQLIDQMTNWCRTLMKRNAHLANAAAASLLMPITQFNANHSSSSHPWSRLTNSTKQQWVLSHAALAKMSWLKGAQILPNSKLSEVKDVVERYVDVSTDFLAECAKDIIHASYDDTNPRVWNGEKPIAEFVTLSMDEKALGQGKPWESVLGGLSAASSFALLADILANGTVYGNDNPTFRKSIFEKLGVQRPNDHVLTSILADEGYDLGGNTLADGVQLANVTRRTLARAGKILFAGVIGVCEVCVEDVLILDESGEADIRFYRPSEKSEREESGKKPARPTYPCKHFDWTEYKLH